MIRVKRKTKEHPYFGKGSKTGYTVNGVEGADIEIMRGEPYTFDIFTPGHPFYLTTDDTGGIGAPQPLTEPTSKGELTITIDDSFPDEFFYQCSLHPKMGGHIMVFDEESDFAVEEDEDRYTSSETDDIMSN